MAVDPVPIYSKQYVRSRGISDIVRKCRATTVEGWAFASSGWNYAAAPLRRNTAGSNTEGYQ